MFREINIKDLKESPAELFDSRWGLLSAGDKNAYNMMTVSWGMLGELWNKDVCTVFVRPQRYTYEFTEKGEYFTVSFFPEKMKKALSICGTKSGRNIDKVSQAGLTPVFTDGTVTFEEAEYTVICRRIAVQTIDPSGFIDGEIESNYPKKDYHLVYIGEIVKAYENRA